MWWAPAAAHQWQFEWSFRILSFGFIEFFLSFIVGTLHSFKLNTFTHCCFWYCLVFRQLRFFVCVLFSLRIIAWKPVKDIKWVFTDESFGCNDANNWPGSSTPPGPVAAYKGATKWPPQRVITRTGPTSVATVPSKRWMNKWVSALSANESLTTVAATARTNSNANRQINTFLASSFISVFFFYCLPYLRFGITNWRHLKSSMVRKKSCDELATPSWLIRFLFW